MKIKLSTLVILFLTQIQVFAQNTWQTAQIISNNTVTTITTNNTEHWFSFSAQSNEIHIGISPADTSSEAAFSSIGLYEIINNNTLLLQQNNGDTIISLDYRSLSIGNQYYIKVQNNTSTEPWKIGIKDVVTIVYEDFSCPPICNNLVYNGTFNDVFSSALINNQLNSLYYNPFNEVADNNGYASYGIYDKMVCTWYAPTGSPQIKQTLNGNTAYMYNQATIPPGAGVPESIATTVKLKTGIQYTINFFYKYTTTCNPAGTQTSTIKFMTSNTVSSSNYSSSGLTLPSPTLSSSSTPYSYVFTPTQDYNSLVIYPDEPSNGRNHLYIDNIKITPTPTTVIPEISGPSTTCNQTGDMTFTISNYDPVHYIYRIKLNGADIGTTITNTFIINVSQFNQQVNLIQVENWCENYGDFTVYECCEPTGYTMFVDENLTNAKVNTVTNSQIVINGTVNVHDNITLSNYDIKFGPMSKLIIDDGYNFTMNGGTLEDACNYPWDGIYIDNSDASVSSKLTLNSLTTVRGAYDAVVSSNNAEIELTNNHFINNDKCIKIRDYKPNLCEPVPFGQPPIVVPPYDAIITGNTFEKIANPFSMFGNFYGIQIDTVYDITIGNESSNKNIFKGINIGIKVNSSSVKIYHNKFENITNNTDPPILTSNSKPMGKIGVLAEKFIVASNQTLNYPTQLSNQCVSSSIIVGKLGVNGGNEFVNCDFGVYSYKHYTEVVNNTFTNQKYNAVWVWDAISKVNYNTIQQQANFWYSIKNDLNAAIFIEKTANPSATYNLQIAEVQNNTLSNTRVGISLIHCSAAPSNNAVKSLVKNNDITFDDYTQTQVPHVHEYTGIWVASCDRVIVSANSINNNSGFSVPTYSEDQLVGVKVDKTRDAWIDHNFNLNYLGTGIRIIGDCHNTQFSCNHFKACEKGIYTVPNSTNGFATVISHQGNWTLNRPQDNFFYQMPNNTGVRVSGNINKQTIFTNGPAQWYYRTANGGFFIDNADDHEGTVMSNPQTSCTNGILPPPDPDDATYDVYRDEIYGQIVRNEMDYILYEDEFEYFDDQYLYEILYNNPDIMYLGEPDDTAYINFYNYLTNSNVREFIEVQELIDENNINQALMDNGAIVAQNVIEANQQYVNEVYLSSFAQDKYFTENQEQTLFAIAMLTPYIGGDAVYSARVMLGINPNDYNLAYRLARPTDSIQTIYNDNLVSIYPNPASTQLTIEFNYNLETSSAFILYDITGRKVLEQNLSKNSNKFTLDISSLQNGVYFYKTSSDNSIKGKLIINN